MTADQKRAHLALLGLSAWKFGSTGDHPTSWRIARAPWKFGAPTIAYVTPYPPTWRRSNLTTPDKYMPAEFSQIPDELLDRLELPLIEQFMALTSQEK